MNSQAKQATPHSQLIAELLDSRVPKTEREHAAVREIERLRIERDEHARWRAKLADDLHDRETQVIELRRQLAEADLDAQRYRDWLRGGENIPPESTRWARWEVRHWDGRHWNTLFAEALDTSIDAAMGGGDAG